MHCAKFVRQTKISVADTKMRTWMDWLRSSSVFNITLIMKVFKQIPMMLMHAYKMMKCGFMLWTLAWICRQNKVTFDVGTIDWVSVMLAAVVFRFMLSTCVCERLQLVVIEDSLIWTISSFLTETNDFIVLLRNKKPWRLVKAW